MAHILDDPMLDMGRGDSMTITLRIPREQMIRLNAVAKHFHTPRAAYIKRAIMAALERDEPLVNKP